MALESRRDKLIYGGFVPIIGAVAGAIAATWFQTASLDQAQLDDVITLLKDPSLTAQQKLQALEIYREITDRPWELIRSLTTTFTMTVSVIVGALVFGGFFTKRT
jgi:hypothetical protein